MNPLGEAICEAELTVGPGEGGAEGGGDLYLPELWKTGKRLTWKDEVGISRLSNIFIFELVVQLDFTPDIESFCMLFDR